MHHSYERDDVENVCFIGVYSSRQKAEAAIERLRRQPGFSDFPECFSIKEYALDKDHWTEGFVTIVPIQVRRLKADEEWETVHAKLLHGSGCYEIIRYDDDDGADWQFKGGDIVRCEERDGILHAIDLAEQHKKA